MATIKIENKHIVIKKSDLDKSDLLRLHNIQDRVARTRKESGRQGYPEYCVVNKDEPYYPDVMQIVMEGELKKMNQKTAKKMFAPRYDEAVYIFAEMFGESPEKMNAELNQAEKVWNEKFGNETVKLVDDYILKHLNVKVDDFHVKIDDVDFFRCPDCGLYRQVQYRDGFMFNTAFIICKCGFQLGIPSKTNSDSFNRLKKHIGFRHKGKVGKESL